MLNHTLHFLLRCHHFLDCSAPVSRSLELHVHDWNDSCNLCLKTALLSCLTVSQQISKLSVLFALTLYCVLHSKEYKFFSNAVLNFILHFATCNTTETHFKNLVLMSSPGSQSQCKASVYTFDVDLMLHCIHSSTVLQLKASLLHKHKKKVKYSVSYYGPNQKHARHYGTCSVFLPTCLAATSVDSNPHSQFYFNYTIKLFLNMSIS
jgi:hypothetical protein